jgi:pimeloyl-ACP methyl ester carboxylesterase
VFLNEFAEDLAPRDMRPSAEFASLLQSAGELGIPHEPAVRYVSRQAVLRGMRFHFTEWGDPAAPPVVLLHGGNQSSHSWDLVSLHLSDRFHVYALDQRGHGDTEWSRELDYSMEAMAADALAFVADQELVRPIVFGHSMGGPVVLLYGARHPGHAAGLVVQSGFARWDTPRLVEGFRRVAGDEVAEIAGRSYAGEPVSDEEWARVFAAFGPHLPNEHRETHTPKNLELNSRGMELIRRLDIVDQLSRVDSPTLVSVGELDPVTPVAAADEIIGALPEGIAQLKVIDEAGHFTWLDGPERYWPMILEFISSTNRRMEF